ncbi:asparaginase [Leeia aquatica]|nr:asparaginase [Leeia aquatica]
MMMSVWKPVAALPQHVPLAISQRGDWVECVHYGSIAVCDASGHLLYRAGDVDTPQFTRSTLKPFQALPLLTSGGVDHFGLTARQLALLCASHSGEPMHVEAVSAMLAQIGGQVSQLQCGCQVPLFYTDHALPADATFTPLHHNCSGKHTGFLAYCQLHGHDHSNHLSPRHPLQQAIREAVAQVCQVDPAGMPMGIDGCSAPNYALPLRALATGYARLAAGVVPGIAGAPLQPLYQAMQTYPDMVSGSGRFDLALTRQGEGRWVAKGGADGVQAIAVQHAGYGIAIKIADGNARALHTVTLALLQQLGLLDHPERTALAAWHQPPLHNAAGLTVGGMVARIELAEHRRP